MMTRKTCWLVAVAALGLLSGCVHRRMHIVTEPPGAMVYVNYQPVGHAPVDYDFVYYGTYLITLQMDGYETQTVKQRVAPPWFAYPPLDFGAEVLYPFEIEDERRLNYTLVPLGQANTADLLQQGEQLRQQGRMLPEPTPPKEPAPTRTPPPTAPTTPAPPPSPALANPPRLTPPPSGR